MPHGYDDRGRVVQHRSSIPVRCPIFRVWPVRRPFPTTEPKHWMELALLTDTVPNRVGTTKQCHEAHRSVPVQPGQRCRHWRRSRPATRLSHNGRIGQGACGNPETTLATGLGHTLCFPCLHGNGLFLKAAVRIRRASTHSDPAQPPSLLHFCLLRIAGEGAWGSVSGSRAQITKPLSLSLSLAPHHGGRPNTFLSRGRCGRLTAPAQCGFSSVTAATATF